MSSDTKHPPCHILFRSKKVVELFSIDENGSSEKKSIKLANGRSTLHSFSPSGSKLIVHLPSSGVQLFDIASITNSSQDSAGPIATLDNSKGVQFMSFSSKGTYILTYEKATKPTEGQSPIPNLKIWSSKDGSLLHGFYMKNCRRSQWPPVQWSHDELLAFHLANNHEIHVYDSNCFTSEIKRFQDKIKCPGTYSFKLPQTFVPTIGSEEDKYLLSTFVQESKGKPAKVSLMRYPDYTGTENKSKPMLVNKSFYQAEECSVQFSPKGDSALILTTTSVDTSGDSYYGSTNLYLLLSENRSGLNGEALSVPLPGANKGNATGPVLDVAWMPNPTKPAAFCVISGRMPAVASLHNGLTAEPTFLFGNAHRNTIVFSPHGRFVTLGGFGNLAGGMDFYDRNKLKKIPQYCPNTGADLGANGNTASCAVGYGWSPSSRYFMVSTTTPRMNVDNGVRLYKYNGLEICDPKIVSWDNQNYAPDQLLAAEFVPALFEKYPDRPQSPAPKRKEGEPGTAPVAAAAAAAPAAYVPPVGRYVPPGARKGGGLSLAERMRKEREGSTIGETKVTAKTSVPGLPGKKLPVGMAASNANDGGKSKNALKKERQRLAKQKKEQEEKEEKERLEKEEKERLEAARNDPAKQAKKLKKTLKQIEELKKRDPTTLNDDQKKKIATESELLEKLAALNV